MKRLIFAFIAAGIWMPILAVFTSADYFRIQAFTLVAAFSVPLTVIVAVPLFYSFRKNVTISACMVGGVGIGFLGTFVFMLMTHFEAALHMAPLLIGSGWISSVLFYFVGVWRNRNLTFNSPATPIGARQ